MSTRLSPQLWTHAVQASMPFFISSGVMFAVASTADCGA